MIHIGIFTDAHYAKELDRVGNRTCSQSLKKVKKILDTLNREVDIFIQLGDLINACGDTKKDMDNIADMQSLLNENEKKCFSVLGNHDVEAARKNVFLPDEEKGWYFFEEDGIRFIVLDGAFTSASISYEDVEWDWTDSLIPCEQVEWLKKTLDETEGQAVILTHQNLDPRGDDPHLIKNAAEVRGILEESGKVKLVLQGHYHHGFKQVHEGIEYFTLRALCEKGDMPCAVLTIDGDSISIEEKELSLK